jgi:pimeloyl-ACP methyl ester carboxylesterase
MKPDSQDIIPNDWTLRLVLRTVLIILPVVSCTSAGTARRVSGTSHRKKATIEGAGHYPHLEYPKQVLDQTEDFVKKQRELEIGLWFRF